jgi:hypothetical protein
VASDWKSSYRPYAGAAFWPRGKREPYRHAEMWFRDEYRDIFEAIHRTGRLDISETIIYDSPPALYANYPMERWKRQVEMEKAKRRRRANPYEEEPYEEEPYEEEEPVEEEPVEELPVPCSPEPDYEVMDDNGKRITQKINYMAVKAARAAKRKGE